MTDSTRLPIGASFAEVAREAPDTPATRPRAWMWPGDEFSQGHAIPGVPGPPVVGTRVRLRVDWGWRWYRSDLAQEPDRVAVRCGPLVISYILESV